MGRLIQVHRRVMTTIPDSEVLVGIAALALTVTGFSGLISVLGRRSTGHWSDAERFQLRQLIELSLAVTFASFIPILVGMVQTQDHALPTATALVGLFHLVIIIRGVSENYRGGKSLSGLPRGVLLVLVVGGIGLIVAAFTASLGLISGAAFFLVANLLWQLLVAAVHFVALLMNTETDAS